MIRYYPIPFHKLFFQFWYMLKKADFLLASDFEGCLTPSDDGEFVSVAGQMYGELVLNKQEMFHGIV